MEHGSSPTNYPGRTPSNQPPKCYGTCGVRPTHLVGHPSSIASNAAAAPGPRVSLSVLLGAGLVSRQAWGVISHRIGGLRTAMLSSAFQATAMAGFVFVTAGSGFVFGPA